MRTCRIRLRNGHQGGACAGKKVDSGKSSVWVRSTVCLREIGGRWFAAHVHNSVPFYMDGSLKAAIDLKP